MNPHSSNTIFVPVDGDAGFTVRGLTIQEMVTIAEQHPDMIPAIKFATHMSKNPSSVPFSAAEQDLANKFLAGWPRLMASIIACACDEPDAVEEALNLPPNVMRNAHEAINALSEESITYLDVMLAPPSSTLQ